MEFSVGLGFNWDHRVTFVDGFGDGAYWVGSIGVGGWNMSMLVPGPGTVLHKV